MIKIRLKIVIEIVDLINGRLTWLLLLVPAGGSRCQLRTLCLRWAILQMIWRVGAMLCNTSDKEGKGGEGENGEADKKMRATMRRLIR